MRSITQDREGDGFALFQVLGEGRRQTRAVSGEEVSVGRKRRPCPLSKSREGSAGERQPWDQPQPLDLYRGQREQAGLRNQRQGEGSPAASVDRDF